MTLKIETIPHTLRRCRPEIERAIGSLTRSMDSVSLANARLNGSSTSMIFSVSRVITSPHTHDACAYRVECATKSMDDVVIVQSTILLLFPSRSTTTTTRCPGLSLFFSPSPPSRTGHWSPTCVYLVSFFNLHVHGHTSSLAVRIEGGRTEELNYVAEELPAIGRRRRQGVCAFQLGLPVDT